MSKKRWGYTDYCKSKSPSKQIPEEMLKPDIYKIETVKITIKDLEAAWNKDSNALPAHISSQFTRLCKNLGL